MGKTISWLLAALLAAGHCHAAGLTAVEERWLRGVWPVLLYARDAGLPLDVVVQPQPTPGVPPLALAYIGNRCKLVFSLRGNPEMEATEQRIEAELFDATLELMAAHELGHCRRHVGGAWFELPAGHPPHLPATLNADVNGDARAAYEEMQAVRREEGYADLVGLAWTQRHHLPLYPRLQAWLVAERMLGRVPGSHHDTLAWARLAGDAARLGSGNVFEAAGALWPQGLDGDL